jgi:hypothetical protein
VLILFESVMIGGTTPVSIVGQTGFGAPPEDEVVVEVLLGDVVAVVAVGVGVGVGVGVAVGVGVGVGATEQVVSIVSVVVETVSANAKALPFHVTVLPIVIPASSISVPIIVEFAPSVVACVGAQKTSHDEAPLESVTTELETVVSAP